MGILIIAVIVGLLIVGVVDKRLSEIEIKLPKQKIIVNVPKTDTIDTIESFSTEEICTEPECNHTMGCRAGKCNYRHPSEMNALDKTYYLEHYSKQFTKQDYANWLNEHNKRGTLYGKHRENYTRMINNNDIIEIKEDQGFSHYMLRTRDFDEDANKHFAAYNSANYT